MHSYGPANRIFECQALVNGTNDFARCRIDFENKIKCRLRN